MGLVRDQDGVLNTTGRFPARGNRPCASESIIRWKSSVGRGKVGWVVKEAEWLASTDQAVMLEYVLTEPRFGYGPAGSVPGIAISRKLRLFAVACCRQVWHLLTNKRQRTAVQVAEWYADGGSGDTRNCPWFPDAVMTDLGYLQIAERHAAEASEANVGTTVAEERVDHAASDTAWNARLLKGMAGDAPDAAQAALLRDIVGNPFRPARLPPRRCPDCGWLSQLYQCPSCNRVGAHPWLTPTILSLAEYAYHERDFDGLPALADALEESGCLDFHVLAHLRHGWPDDGPHVRGCWALDLLLGKS